MILQRWLCPKYLPENDPELFYWFDASDTSTLKGAGGAAITDGATVYEWLNKKGPQKFVQSGTIARPTWAVSGPGGRPGLRFGGNHALGLDNLTGLTSLSGMTAVIVASVDNPAVTQTQFSLFAPSPFNRNRILVHVLNGNVRSHCRQNDTHFGSTGEDGPAFSNVPFIATASANYADGDVRFCRDGILYLQDQFDATGLSPSTNPGSIGIGTQGLGSLNDQRMTGYIFGLMLWRCALTPEELVGPHHYLRTKWRIEPEKTI